MRRLFIAWGCFFVSISDSYGACVKSSELTLRSEASGNSSASWKVGKHMPLIELEKKGSWVKVRDLDGSTHWAPASGLTSRYQCFAIRTQQASLRIGPGNEHPLAEIPSVGKYVSFKRVEFEPPWYLGEDESGDLFWIHEKNIWRPMKVRSLTY